MGIVLASQVFPVTQLTIGLYGWTRAVLTLVVLLLMLGVLLLALTEKAAAGNRWLQVSLIGAQILLLAVVKMWLYPYAHPLELMVGWLFLLLWPGLRPWLGYIAVLVVYCFNYVNGLDAPEHHIFIIDINHMSTLSVVAFTTLMWFVVGVAVHALAGVIALTRELHAARTEVARLSAAEERRKMSQLLHDEVGHTMVAIMLRTELAQRLMSTAQERANVELCGVYDAAKKTLQNIRAIAHNNLGTEFERELCGAMNLLKTAGVNCDLHTTVAPLGPAAEILAWNLREATTNILKHSNATTCEIVLRDDGKQYHLSIRNNCSRQSESTGGGSGLAMIHERTAREGGKVTVDRTGDVFTLALSVPHGLVGKRVQTSSADPRETTS
ncbi:sensor histidine kinase [Amycolatopsis orientalis]|uniref:sensor histidine kinase n=1 Tax=Amycolatopsis orientalis TaxID=31958 RepID=UPI001268B480|nr:histidine kinase [Amycolatopsis orientalis]